MKFYRFESKNQMLIYKSKPTIDDLTLLELRRYASMFDSVKVNNYLRSRYLQEEILHVLDNYSVELQEQFRLSIIKQIKENMANEIYFVPFHIDRNQYWILSNQDDTYVKKYVKYGIEYYETDNEIHECYQGKTNDFRIYYYRLAILYLEMIYRLMLLNDSPLDIDILRIIKAKLFNDPELNTLRDYVKTDNKIFPIQIIKKNDIKCIN